MIVVWGLFKAYSTEREREENRNISIRIMFGPFWFQKR